MLERISGGFKKSSGETKWDLNDKNSPQYDKKVLSEIYSDPETGCRQLAGPAILMVRGVRREETKLESV